MSKQAKVPVRIIGMPQAATEKNEMAIYPVACDLPGAGNRAGNFGLRFQRKNFICIEKQDPFVLKGKVFQGPIFLFRPRSVEVKLLHPRSVASGDFERAV